MKRSSGMAGGWQAAACLLWLVLPNAGAAQEPAPAAGPSTWYAQRVTQGGGGMGVEHLWSKGASLRSEVVVSAHPIVTVVHGDRYWVLDRLTGEGISVQRHPNSVAADDPTRRPFGDEAERLQSQGGEFVGDEELGGDASCRLYKLTDDRGRQEVCVRDDELGLPVILRNWDRQTNRTHVVQYVNWFRDLEIDGSFFMPQAGLNLKGYTYEAYMKAVNEQSVGPAPVLYPHLLHGEPEE